MDQLPRFGKRELICLLLFTCNYVVSAWRGFLFLWVLGIGYVILLWHSLSLPLISLRKYLNPFKRPSMYPSISKCNAKSCNCCQHLCTNTTITSSVNGRTFSVINNSDLD